MNEDARPDINFDHSKIEKKWRQYWEENRTYQVDLHSAEKPFYNLMMFPYPSAEGLHVGNVFAFTGSDVYGRFMKLRGYDVFEPMGYDAFGMHSENFAIKQGIHPATLVPNNIRNFRKQLMTIGGMFDWEHEVSTTDADYYKWTQWVLIQLFKGGLMERKTGNVNWCPSCQTVLANEQAEGGKCERCDSEIEQRNIEQWYFLISKYADRLLKNLSWIDWSEVTKKAQENWIGKSEGAEIDFQIADHDEKIRVFTTRPDTLFGATYMVLAPEHPLVAELTTPDLKETVKNYLTQTVHKNQLERTDLNLEKTGVPIGAYAINPVNEEKIPIWISDYVLMDYGTGAIMAVPAHDERDFEFAKKFNLPIRCVVSPDGKARVMEEANSEEGIMVNSGQFSGMTSAEGKQAIIEMLKEKGIGEGKVTYRLRDWCISRQRYWGTPIPIVYCDKCGVVAVAEEDLPVLLPEMEDYRPDGSGKSPLSRDADFVNTTCPKCGGPARRETDVADNFLDSAWYFLRYPSTEYDDRPYDEELTKKWLPVDMYIGGNEHAVLHLMYTRFIVMALYDLGLLPFEEPFKKFRAHGLIIKDGAKMSKSRGNVINPDEYIAEHGTDTFRTYLMFLAPLYEGGDFREEGIMGVRRFLERLYRFVNETSFDDETTEPKETTHKLHKIIKKVTQDIETLNYNTAVAGLMELLNFYRDKNCKRRSEIEALLIMVAPFAPHLAEELWETLGNEPSIYKALWPEYDEALTVDEIIELVVQVNGKLRARMHVPRDLDEQTAVTKAQNDENIARFIEGKTIRKAIYVPNRLVNLVVK